MEYWRDLGIFDILILITCYITPELSVSVCLEKMSHCCMCFSFRVEIIIINKRFCRPNVLVFQCNFVIASVLDVIVSYLVLHLTGCTFSDLISSVLRFKHALPA